MNTSHEYVVTTNHSYRSRSIHRERCQLIGHPMGRNHQYQLTLRETLMPPLIPGCNLHICSNYEPGLMPFWPRRRSTP